VEPGKKSSQKKTRGDVCEEYKCAPERKKTEHYVLRLYIAGNNVRSRTAVENIRKICEENLNGRYELDIIDIYQVKLKNQVDLVIAAPTLVKQLPLPPRRIIGDMTNKDKILIGLDLLPKS
jgi:circadian clock protein KaiB